MKKIPLSRGLFTFVDDGDYEQLIQWRWTFDGRYATRKNKEHKKIYMHRYILNPPTGFICDHVNRDCLDNQRANLRLANYQQNEYNSRGKNGILGVKGVCITASKTYCAFIKHNRRSINLGTFKTIDEAANAYKNAAIRFGKEFARCQ